MRRKKSGKNVIILLVMTAVTVAVWVGFEVYRAYTKVTPPTGLEKYLKPLDPTLNTVVFDKLKQRSP